MTARLFARVLETPCGGELTISTDEARTLAEALARTQRGSWEFMDELVAKGHAVFLGRKLTVNGRLQSEPEP